MLPIALHAINLYAFNILKNWPQMTPLRLQGPLLTSTGFN